MLKLKVIYYIMAPNAKYKQLRAPTQRQLYTDPITETPTKNIELQA